MLLITFYNTDKQGVKKQTKKHPDKIEPQKNEGNINQKHGFLKAVSCLSFPV